MSSMYPPITISINRAVSFCSSSLLGEYWVIHIMKARDGTATMISSEAKTSRVKSNHAMRLEVLPIELRINSG